MTLVSSWSALTINVADDERFVGYATGETNRSP
jgi:hypothetical protein